MELSFSTQLYTDVHVLDPKETKEVRRLSERTSLSNLKPSHPSSAGPFQKMTASVKHHRQNTQY